ncbi:GntR family transcriptional regulator [Phycicoccus endophyticus]|uniref:GntR family transcriptional regulator n=1 Tax=Phycicoccus endophyticus TaxID=1690220 RepID=UPI001E41C654|nr:GntR family transcriptional regulator [Phycicoccus endophyticus]
MSTPVLPPLGGSARSLADQVAAAIRDGVRTGALVPGALYSAYQLADDLGVSRSPVREALLRLAETGMVVLERNRGFRVHRPGPREVAEVFHLRLLLEVPVVERVAAAPPAGLVDALYEELRAMSAAAAAGDETTFMAHDQRLHDHVLLAGGNRRLASSVAHLRDVTRLLGASTVGQSRDLAAVADEHRPVVRAIETRDPDAAARAMREHLVHTGRLLVHQENEVLADGTRDVEALWAEVVGD